MDIDSLYINSISNAAGSLSISLGMMELLKSKYKKVAYFKPIVSEVDDLDILLILNHFKLEQKYDQCFCFDILTLEKLLSTNSEDIIYDKIIKQYNQLKESYDFVLIQGIKDIEIGSSFGSNLNFTISKNLSVPLLSVVDGHQKSFDIIDEEIKIVCQNIKFNHLDNFGIIVNKVIDKEYEDLNIYLSKNRYDTTVFTLPYINKVDILTLNDIVNTQNIKEQYGKKSYLNRAIDDIKIVSAKNSTDILSKSNINTLIVTSYDRDDIISFLAMSCISNKNNNSQSILLTNYDNSDNRFLNLLSNIENIPLTILTTTLNEFELLKNISNISSKVLYKNHSKISLLLENFNRYIDTNLLTNRLSFTKNNIVTPMMFEYKIFQKAKQNKQNIVLPESNDPRILQACSIVLNREIVNITLLGDIEATRKKALELGVDISKATIIDPKTSDLTNIFAEKFYKLRSHKGVLPNTALEMMREDPNYFATMMVDLGYASGMVSGASHTTAQTVRPALQIIKTKEGIDIVSSLFFMCLDDKVLVYADCAINQNPNAKELAQIAISSSDTAKAFDIEPKVAMLSYSTGCSGDGVDVKEVIEATNIAKKTIKYEIDGPLQYDAAVDIEVAKKKAPDSKVAGGANILIFPDLNTGNNTYKAVQRSSGALAIGPILQGLKKPINDLSRGCTVKDIINTIAITAIQAQGDQNDTCNK